MKFIDILESNSIKKTFLLIVFIMINGVTSYGQFFNEEIQAKILVEKNSEFYTFHAAVSYTHLTLPTKA